MPESVAWYRRFGGIATDLAPEFGHNGEDIGLNSRANRISADMCLRQQLGFSDLLAQAFQFR